MNFAMARKIIAAAVLASCLMLAQSSEPTDPKDVFERGQRALAAGNYADAERDFDHLLQMGMRSAPVYTNLGVAYLRAGNFDGAIGMLKEAKKLAPAMTGIDLNLGLAYYKQRDSTVQAARVQTSRAVFRDRSLGGSSQRPGALSQWHLPLHDG